MEADGNMFGRGFASAPRKSACVRRSAYLSVKNGVFLCYAGWEEVKLCHGFLCFFFYATEANAIDYQVNVRNIWTFADFVRAVL